MAKKWRTKPQGFTSLCRQAQLHSKSAAFSSLPRRNEMKPGHLHKKREALLVKSSASLSCEIFSLSRVRMVSFFNNASLTRLQCRHFFAKMYL